MNLKTPNKSSTKKGDPKIASIEKNFFAVEDIFEYDCDDFVSTDKINLVIEEET